MVNIGHEKKYLTHIGLNCGTFVLELQNVSKNPCVTPITHTSKILHVG